MINFKIFARKKLHCCQQHIPHMKDKMTKDKSVYVNIDNIFTALHVYYLSLIVNEPNTVQSAQNSFECTIALLVNPIPIFYLLANESQSQGTESHFPSKKGNKGNSQLSFNVRFQNLQSQL